MKGVEGLDLLFHSDNKVLPVTLENILVVPGIRHDLFPFQTWDRSGGDFTGKDDDISLLGGTLRSPIQGGLDR